MDLSQVSSAFIAGLVSFLMPCTMPLIPSFLAFIGGSISKVDENRRTHFSITISSLFFVLGFSLVFVFLGVAVSVLSHALGIYRIWLSRASGLLIVVVGLALLDVHKIGMFNFLRGIRIPSFVKPGKYRSSFALGLALGCGWSPCIGPILGSILLLASSAGTAVQGGMLMFIFSLGLGTPFVLGAALGEKYIHIIKKKVRFLKYMRIISAIFLILLGILQIADKLEITSKLIFYYWKYINSSSLINYL